MMYFLKNHYTVQWFPKHTFFLFIIQYNDFLHYFFFYHQWINRILLICNLLTFLTKWGSFFEYFSCPNTLNETSWIANLFVSYLCLKVVMWYDALEFSFLGKKIDRDQKEHPLIILKKNKDLSWFSFVKIRFLEKLLKIVRELEGW